MITATAVRPQLPPARSQQMIEMVRNAVGGFDVDAYHAMEQRDNQLIEQEILHGSGSTKFVYDFEITRGNRVSGVSVIGARHLAAHYGGLKHRLVASVQKTGELFTFTSYPAENMPMNVNCSVVPELATEEDFYGSVVEVADIKTGNTIQIERRESRYERRRDNSTFERLHYATIAQSKAYRNAILALLPQDIIIRWKEQMLRLGKNETITASVIDEKRSNVLQFAARNALALDRHAVEGLTMEQIAGLGDAAREGKLPAFVNAAKALGLELQLSQDGQASEPGALQQGQATPGISTATDQPEKAGGDVITEPAKADQPVVAGEQNSAGGSPDRRQEGSVAPPSGGATPKVNFDV